MIELLIDYPWLLLPVIACSSVAAGWAAAALIEGVLQAVHRGRIRARGNRRRR